MAQPASKRKFSVEFHPMSPDEIERTMQFLLRQQAQFAADMARVEAELLRFETNLEKLSAKTDNIADGLIGLTGVVGQLTSNVWRLSDMFERHLREQYGHAPS